MENKVLLESKYLFEGYGFSDGAFWGLSKALKAPFLSVIEHDYFYKVKLLGIKNPTKQALIIIETKSKKV